MTDLVGAVAGYGLRGEGPLATEPLDDRRWDELLASVRAARITGHLVAALDRGSLPARPSQLEQALQAHEGALSLDLCLERLLLDVSAALEADGIRPCVLKGPALAHSVYPDPSLRSFGDVDLLVAEPSYDATIECLAARGAHRRYAEPRPGFDRRFGKGACLVTTDGLEIDLHRTFVAGPYAMTVRNADLLTATTTFRLGDRDLTALGAPQRFLHACFHAALGDTTPRLSALRDIAQIVLHAPPEPERVRELATRWRAVAVVQRAVRLAAATLAVDLDAPLTRWALEHQPTTFERRALHAYVGPRRSYAGQSVAGLRAVRGVAAKAAYARALLGADADYVRERDGGYLRRLRRGLRLVIDERVTP